MKRIEGSIYETKSHKKGSNGVSYTAEINYRGVRIRKSSVKRSVCEDWINSIVSEIKLAYEEKDKAVRLANEREKEKINEIIHKAKLHDMHFKSTASAMGIERTEHYRTYIIFNPLSGLYKIGKSKDIYRRLVAYSLPELELVCYSEIDMEKELHEMFRSKRQLGEWFSLDENDIKELENEKKFVLL